MNRYLKVFTLFILSIGVFYSIDGFSQTKTKKAALSKREAERHAIHFRDSVMRSLNKSDTSISSLLQRIEQYTTSFNQIKNSLSAGLDTTDVSQQLPPIVKRINKIDSVANTHKSSTLRYLFVLRDNIDHMQGKLDDWQSDLQDINTKLVQNQSDLLKFFKDTILKTTPSDSVVRKTFFLQLREVKKLWHKTDSTNRKALTSVNLLQDKIAISYTKILDENDQIDAKIRGFALKAISGESSYIWLPDTQYNDFKPALKSTIKLNTLLFNYFLKSETATHFIGIAFFVLILIWILYTRARILKHNEDPWAIFSEANYIGKKPFVSSILIATTLIPFFYDHPPTVFLEILVFASILLSLILIKPEVSKTVFRFLTLLLCLYIAYAVSNLFISISNIDRYAVFVLSIISIISGYRFYKKIKTTTDKDLSYATLATQIFIVLQVLSFLLNMTGRFSLAKILGITAVFNLWMLVILFIVVNIIIQALFLQFKIKRDNNSIINWIDYNLVQKKFKNTLVVAASLLWLFFLLQNLNIDDWARDSIGDILDDSRTIGGATFTFGGFVIFIFVIWLSSIASKLISYLYDVSAQRVTDLSVAKKKNRTSALIIRMAVFSVGFLLAVAASGFPLDKLTIIISAFGVGIGFGLQNIVNNLVSGLILAFEKPINIGDVVAVDGHTGTMKEIGIRSSKLVTGDGSEVIIPNGDLISHQVINWTLSNSNRQIELKVIAAYGIDIEKVKNVLKGLLTNRDDIMNSPSPAVFVNGVTESAVEFKILFWVADISATSELRSRILSEIYQAVGKEEIKLPSTQNNVFVHFPDGVPLQNIEKKTDKKERKDTKENPPE
ncbi:mechanosensitive ion channel-like protein [Mucilaginibacter frigoritolerans]|uniref:Mechanosensitive ion channel-like protein n=1 Tax=Mucilaginibacter frigoritolerans TaxID=652788 RepID=A0A562TWV0_9SPHI|nr:mechanosensitive ion channel domain-containing protein [Mucilaginibacter frigoritolerans]TWI98052.1 mechanosensitive ion channel-like protein [Mucilaginibacter frigoritolerans]